MQDITVVPIKNGLNNTQVKSEKKKIIPVPEGLFPLPTICTFIGHKGLGKTNAAINLIKEYQDFGSLNEVYILSPTYHSNPEFEVLNIADDHVYTNVDTVQQDLTTIIDKILKSIDDYILYREFVKAWKRVQAGKGSFTDHLTVQQNGNEPPEVVEEPRPVIIMDDLSHSKIYSASKDNPFNNLALRHRHIGGQVGGEKFGVTVVMMVQTFKSGVPKVIRDGACNQFFMYETHDKKCLEGIYESVAGCLTYEMFIKLFSYATQHPHDFFTMDPYNPDKNKRFRRNFNEYLQIPEEPLSELLKNRRKMKERRAEPTLESLKRRIKKLKTS